MTNAGRTGSMAILLTPSFAMYGAGIQYVCITFMILSALPYVRYVQLMAGTAAPLWRDSQIRAFFAVLGVAVAGLTLWLWATGIAPGEEGLRGALFNTVSIITGAGFSSTDYMLWGALPVTAIFFIGLIGGLLRLHDLLGEDLSLSAPVRGGERADPPHPLAPWRLHAPLRGARGGR